MTLRRLLPILVGLAVIIIALANLVDVAWPGMAAHFEVLSRLVPQRAAPWAHALAGPVAVLMLGLGWALTQRRRAAWAIAVGVMGVMAVTMAGERRVADAVACGVLAVLLHLARAAFAVLPPDDAVRRALWRVPFAGAGAFVVGVLGVLVARGDAVPEISGGDVVREAVALLVWRAGPADFPAAFHWLPEALALVSIVALVVVLAPLIRRPVLVPEPRTALARRRVDDLVSRHDSGSLSSFVLRDDHNWLFSDDRDAVLAYQVEAGVLLVAGDPVGCPASLDGLAVKAADVANRHGLLLGVMAGSDHLRPMWRRAGLRAMYLGDEAVVEVPAFSLEGRPIRKVRQSVNRLEREGYCVRLTRVRDLGASERAALVAFRAECRDGAAERGFSMAHRRIDDYGSQPAWVVVAYAPDGAPAGLMHFVPGHRGGSQSLALQARGAGTPNGLMEFVVVRAIEGFRAMGVTEVSLNFVTGGRYFRDQSTAVNRLFNRGFRASDRWFQVKSLEKFTEKFFPRWDARYVMHPGLAWGLVRVGMAAMWCEGQLPRPRALFRRGTAEQPAAYPSAEGVTETH